MPSQPEVVSPALLDVARRLFSSPLLDRFYLVGGTALALQLCHRRSIDIDLFTDAAFDSQQIADWVTQQANAASVESGKNLVRCFIAGVKVDILAHQYPLLDPPSLNNGIRMAGLRDIAAMKLNAVTNRGAKKDFWDIAVLLGQFPLPAILDFYAQKYPSANRWSAIKSLCYFADADAESVPIVDFTGMSWDQVKTRIREACASFLKC